MSAGSQSASAAASAYNLRPYRHEVNGLADGQGTIGELLCALSFTSDLGMGQPLEHGLRTAYLGLMLGDRLRIGPEDREAVFYGALTKDTG